MTYFLARKAEKEFRNYRELALNYWSDAPADARRRIDRHDGVSSPQSDESSVLRERLNHLYPKVQRYALELGTSVIAASYPAPAVGGPVLRTNLLALVVDQHAGHSRVPREDVLDAIDRCIGAAKAKRDELLWKEALNPFWYIIEAFAFILRVPFLILRRAGLPDKVEETAWAHFIKVLLAIGLLGICAYFGIKVTFGDVLKLWRG